MFHLFETTTPASFGANPLAGTDLPALRDALAHRITVGMIGADDLLSVQLGHAVAADGDFRDQCLYAALAASSHRHRDAGVILCRLAAPLRGDERAALLLLAADLFLCGSDESLVLALFALQNAVVEVENIAEGSHGWTIADAITRKVPAWKYRGKLVQALYENPAVLAITDTFPEPVPVIV